MPCFAQPMTSDELRYAHKRTAMMLMNNLWVRGYVDAIPRDSECVQVLCRFTKTVEPKTVERLKKDHKDIYLTLRDWTRHHVHFDIDDKVAQFRKTITPLVSSRFKTL